jgi:multidrug efflux pump subunit AcrA (membrane-fusion protein)
MTYMTKYIILLFGVASLLTGCGQQLEETRPVRKTVSETVFATGILEAQNTYVLTAQSEGYLVNLQLRENEPVTKNQVVGIIDNKAQQVSTENAAELYDLALLNAESSAPSLAAARIAVSSARDQLELDSIQEMRYRKLWEANSIARSDYDRTLLQYKNARARWENAIQDLRLMERNARQQVLINQGQKDRNNVLLSQREIRIPFPGKVYYRYKEIGDRVSPGERIALIGDPSLIYAKLSVDEGSISKIKTGQEAVVVLNTDKQRTYKAVVSEVLPAFNEATQSFTCKLHFTDSLDFRIINTQLQANIHIGTRQDILLIPRRFIRFGNSVTVKGSESPRTIKTGIISNEWIEVKEGLDENSVITTPKTR